MCTATVIHAGSAARTWRRRAAAWGIGLLVLLMPACESGGHFTLLGYTSRPNYDDRFHSVFVPIFKNVTFYRGLEFDVTRAVVREIETKTPYKVVSDRERADTELSGIILSSTKNILNRNQLNEVREGEMVISVQVTWKDLHTGEILSAPRRAGAPAPIYELAPAAGASAGTALNPLLTTGPTPPLAVETPAIPDGETLPRPTPVPGAEQPPGIDPALPVPPPPVPLTGPPPGVSVMATYNFIPEIGQSTTTALKTAADRLAVQIVSMMEKPW
ncbi:MAG: hypothetical protein K2R98_17420 [Gemmataceae bacterium]|nr:hypothetical protein [Gemmataceae bacterium]